MSEERNNEITEKKPYSIKYGLLLGGMTAVPLIALFYLGEKVAGLPFVPFDIFDWMARVLPGDLITLGIDTIVSIVDLLNLGSTSTSAKLIEQLSALFLFIAAGSFLGGILSWLMNRGQGRFTAGGTVGAAAFLFVLIVEFNLPLGDRSLFSLLWTGLITVGWGFANGYLNDLVYGSEQTDDASGRRRVLAWTAGGSLVLFLTGAGLGKLISQEEAEVIADSAAGPDPSFDSPSPESNAYPSPDAGSGTSAPVDIEVVPTRERVEPAPGTRPELTSNDDFYTIDINTRPPSIDQSEWSLQAEGLFDNPRSYSLDELKAFPTVTQPITLSCISNRVGGDLIGTSYWTGLRLKDLLDDLGVQPSAKELMIDSADGFYESVIMDDMMDPRTLLVYAMNDEPLPQGHGYPLRIYIPNRYGMKQPKWITQITAVSEEVMGYWVVRGWSQEARPQIVSVIDTIARNEPNEDGTIPVGGIAWAGDRGIEKVELQVDGGEWVETTLRLPPLSQLTWVQWRYDWQPQPGSHEFQVRAVDGNGMLQIEEESGVRPDGATGYHSKEVRI